MGSAYCLPRVNGLETVQQRTLRLLVMHGCDVTLVQETTNTFSELMANNLEGESQCDA